MVPETPTLRRRAATLLRGRGTRYGRSPRSQARPRRERTSSLPLRRLTASQAGRVRELVLTSRTRPRDQLEADGDIRTGITIPRASSESRTRVAARVRLALGSARWRRTPVGGSSAARVTRASAVRHPSLGHHERVRPRGAREGARPSSPDGRPIPLMHRARGRCRRRRRGCGTNDPRIFAPMFVSTLKRVKASVRTIARGAPCRLRTSRPCRRVQSDATAGAGTSSPGQTTRAASRRRTTRPPPPEPPAPTRPPPPGRRSPAPIALRRHGRRRQGRRPACRGSATKPRIEAAYAAPAGISSSTKPHEFRLAPEQLLGAQAELSPKAIRPRAPRAARSDRCRSDVDVVAGSRPARTWERLATQDRPHGSATRASSPDGFAARAPSSRAEGRRLKRLAYRPLDQHGARARTARAPIRLPRRHPEAEGRRRSSLDEGDRHPRAARTGCSSSTAQSTCRWLRGRHGQVRLSDAARRLQRSPIKQRDPWWYPPPVSVGPGRRSRCRPGRATRSGRAGWVSQAATSASTAHRTPPRSATRPPTAASACGFPTPSGSSGAAREGRNSGLHRRPVVVSPAHPARRPGARPSALVVLLFTSFSRWSLSANEGGDLVEEGRTAGELAGGA